MLSAVTEIMQKFNFVDFVARGENSANNPAAGFPRDSSNSIGSYVRHYGRQYGIKKESAASTGGGSVYRYKIFES